MDGKWEYLINESVTIFSWLLCLLLFVLKAHLRHKGWNFQYFIWKAWNVNFTLIIYTRSIMIYLDSEATLYYVNFNNFKILNFISLFCVGEFYSHGSVEFMNVALSIQIFICLWISICWKLYIFIRREFCVHKKKIIHEA